MDYMELFGQKSRRNSAQYSLGAEFTPLTTMKPTRIIIIAVVLLFELTAIGLAQQKPAQKPSDLLSLFFGQPSGPDLVTHWAAGARTFAARSYCPAA